MAMISKQRIGPLAIVALVLWPMMLWATMLPWSARFATYGVIMTSFAQLSGLVGITLFSLVLILGARVAWLENYFGGLNRIYILHHWLGGAAFILLLLHPLFTAAVVLPVSVAQAAALIWPLASVELFLAWAALLVMISLLILTFYFRPEYQVWKFTHKFLGAAFFLGGLHAFLIPSDIARNGWLRWYILGLAMLALIIYSRHSILDAHRKYWYRVERVEKLNDAVWRIVMMADIHAMRYLSGQFGWFRFIDGEIRAERHPFSFSSASNNDQLEITVKDLGNFTHSLVRLKPGTIVEAQGPYGRFNFRRSRYKKQVWVGGGIGMTPFIGMSRDLRAEAKNSYDISLIFAVRNHHELFALDDLCAAEKEAARKLNLTVWFSDERGYLTAHKIKDLIGGSLKEASFFICGPGLMMTNLREQLLAEGVAGRDIYSEEFEL
jgi:predicted ferric reductase